MLLGLVVWGGVLSSILTNATPSVLRSWGAAFLGDFELALHSYSAFLFLSF